MKKKLEKTKKLVKKHIHNWKLVCQFNGCKEERHHIIVSNKIN